MFDLLILIVPTSAMLLSAISYAVKVYREETLRRKFDSDISEELDNVVESMVKFQEVAHKFPNNVTDNAKVGDLFIAEGEVFCNTGDSYVRLPSTNSHMHSQLHLPTNCKNCGAPLHGNRCEFCDTEYN